MTSGQVRNQVRYTIELGFDQLHKVADVVTFPLAPLDGAVHGVARGVLNWLTDTHPQKQAKCKPAYTSPQPAAYPQPNPNWNHYGNPPPPRGYSWSSFGHGTIGNHGDQEISNVTNGDNNFKLGNFGGA